EAAKRMSGWAPLGRGFRRTARDGGSGVDVFGERLVELKLRAGIAVGGVIAGGLFEVELGLGRPPGGRDGWRAVGEAQVDEDRPDDAGLGEEGDDPHGAAAGGADQGQDLVDAREEQGPGKAGRAAAAGWSLGARALGSGR